MYSSIFIKCYCVTKNYPYVFLSYYYAWLGYLKSQFSPVYFYSYCKRQTPVLICIIWVSPIKVDFITHKWFIARDNLLILFIWFCHNKWHVRVFLAMTHVSVNMYIFRFYNGISILFVDTSFKILNMRCLKIHFIIINVITFATTLFFLLLPQQSNLKQTYFR